jgi:transcription factor SFP1
MEKEKPYRCEICGKRYKNLNGLKYHKAHSPPCNPDFKLGNVMGTGSGAGGALNIQNMEIEALHTLGMAGPLCGIGEESMIQ